MKIQIIAFARIAAHRFMGLDDFCCLPMCKQIDKVCQITEDAYSAFTGESIPTDVMDEVRNWVFGELNDDDW
jgi:hypothetical protein